MSTVKMIHGEAAASNCVCIYKQHIHIIAIAVRSLTSVHHPRLSELQLHKMLLNSVEWAFPSINKLIISAGGIQ